MPDDTPSNVRLQLIERLREYVPPKEHRPLNDSAGRARRQFRADLIEAADTIERLEAERDAENKRAQEFSGAIWEAWTALKRIAEAGEDELTHPEIQDIAAAAIPPNRTDGAEAKLATLEAERERDAAVLEADGHSFKLAEKCPMCGRPIDDARIDERIVNVRFNHPGGHSATEGITLPLALKMAEESGGSVDVYLSDHRCWFRLVEGSAWRIETLRAALQHAQEQVGEDRG